MLNNPLTLDVRSLALMRVTMAAVALSDLASRWTIAVDFYSDAGILTQGDLLTSGLREWPGVFLLTSGSGLVERLVIGVGIAAAIALGLGWRTRLATFACWLMVTAIHVRNPLVNFGGDVLLRMLLFFSCFLPLGAWASLDRRFGRGGPVEPVLNAGGIGLQVQVFLVFLIAGLAKAVNPVWQQGLGAAQAFDHEFLATGLAAGLRESHALGFVLTHATTVVELAGAFLLFSPVWTGPVRTFCIAAMSAMCASFSLALHVGIFPVMGIVGLLGLLPAWPWERLGVTISGDSAPRPGSSASLSPGSAVSGILVGLALLFLFVWHVGLWQQAGYRAPEWIRWYGELLQLEQRWGMFTRIPATGWFEVRGTLIDGSQVDLLSDGGPIPEEPVGAREDASVRPPEDIPGLFAGTRWRVFFLAMSESPLDRDRRAGRYGRYLCREWNRREEGDAQLANLEIVFHWRRLRRHPDEEKIYTREVLWTHWCQGRPPAL